MFLIIFMNELTALFFVHGLGSLLTFPASCSKDVVNVRACCRAMSHDMLYRFLVCCWTYFHSHWQDVPFKHSKWRAEGSKVITVFFQMHLVESVLQIQKGETEITMLVSQLVLNQREREVFPFKLSTTPRETSLVDFGSVETSG